MGKAHPGFPCGTGSLPVPLVPREVEGPTTHQVYFRGWPGGGAGRCRKPSAEAEGAPNKDSGRCRKPATDVEGAPNEGTNPHPIRFPHTPVGERPCPPLPR